MSHIPELLNCIERYYKSGHEIIIIDDGSNDGSYEILSRCDFIKLYKFNNNLGKGIALKKGISKSKKEKLIIFDGDLELHPNEINKLMILDKNNKPAKANRYQMKNRYQQTIGNILLTYFFNILHRSKLQDALCCAKSFYKSDIQNKNLQSYKFDIDVEISSVLISSYPDFKNVDLKYRRRSKSEGKKLRLRDSVGIISRMLITFYKR